MPVAKELRTNPALEAQVFWYKYRREIAILLVLAIVAIIAIAGYRLYRDRREATAATLFSGAKTPAAVRGSDQSLWRHRCCCLRLSVAGGFRAKTGEVFGSECNAAEVSREVSAARTGKHSANGDGGEPGGDGQTGRSSRNLPTNCIG